MTPRIILITGASSGVGYATTKILTTISTNYHIILAARTLSKAQTAIAQLTPQNPTDTTNTKITPLELDVTFHASITAAYALISAQFTHIDALINNAGVGNGDADISTRFHACLETNVIGPALVSEIFRPLLLKSANPYSIYVSSGAGSFSSSIARFEASKAQSNSNSNATSKFPEPENADAYHVSKAALNMLALHEHHVYGKQGLKVFAMSPGFVASNLRGTSEELRNGWGMAGPAEVAGEFMLEILEGKRDADMGKLIRREGVMGW